MADDEKDATAETTPPVEPSATPKPVETTGVQNGESKIAKPFHRDPHSEWTASDRRGPLESADGENFVPAHDAEVEFEPAHNPDSSHPSPGPSSPSEPVSAAAAPEPSRVEPKRSLLPVAAGLVIGAIVGAGSAWLVYSQGYGDDGDAQKIAALSSRVDALDKKSGAQPALDKLQSDVSALQGKVADLGKTSAPNSPNGISSKAPAAAAPSANDPTLTAKVAALAAAVDALKSRPAAAPAQADTGAKVAALQSGLADAQKQAAGAQSGFDRIESEQKALGDKIAALSSAVADARKQAQGAQSGLAGFEDRQKALEGKLGSPALAVVADSLVQQISSGQPFARQVDALAALGADSAKIAVLRENAAQGVPSAQTLLSSWKPLEEPVIATGNKAAANANFGERLQHGLFGLVSVHRADDTVGNDLASRVNLIAGDLSNGDTAGASTAWQALPADAKAKSASWGAQAKTAADALAAAHDLQHQAIDALGAKKS